MKQSQSTSSILLVRPTAFHFNEETALDNHFQMPISGKSFDEIQAAARNEFDHFVDVLKNHDIDVFIMEDTASPATPDSIFPNNWVSFHADGRVVVYPMLAENRRKERRNDIFVTLQESGFSINEKVDYSSYESENRFLEGTGSMVLDRSNRLVYAALSKRTNKQLLQTFCSDFQYTPITFHAYQTIGSSRELIYHTNVMMSVCSEVAIVCLEAIDNEEERTRVEQSLIQSGKQIISITEGQTERFAGNMLEVKNRKGERAMVMSSSAFQSLRNDQVTLIEQYSPIIHSDLGTIESIGGGSARCMIAEVFLPKSI